MTRSCRHRSFFRGYFSPSRPLATPDQNEARPNPLRRALSLPFALVGGLWLLWWLGFNMSVAVAVGFIALAGVAAETGVIMLIYLDHAAEDVRAHCLAD